MKLILLLFHTCSFIVSFLPFIYQTDKLEEFLEALF